MSSNGEHICTSILSDFINEHDVIGNDIMSELNKFDQFIKDHKVPTREQCNFAINLDNEYPLDYSQKRQQEEPSHIAEKHTSEVVRTQQDKLLDLQSAELWIGELKRIKKNNYQKHSEEFINEIDKILCNEQSSSNVQDFCDVSTLSCSSPLSDTSTTFLLNSNTGSEKPMKRTFGQCDVCYRTFRDLYNLRIHKMIHTGEKPHQCEECGKRFRQYNKLKIHSVTHSNKKPYVCEVCGKGFRFRNYLVIHKRLHSSENPYKCKLCNDYFHSLHLRRLHFKLKHCETQRFTCTICKKVFTSQCYLTAHQKRHTQQRDFKCSTCEKCFYTLSQLKDHNLVHTKHKPYKCKECTACFQRKSNYTQHIKIHTGLKSYVCPMCSKSFAQKAGLCGHIKTHKNSMEETI